MAVAVLPIAVFAVLVAAGAVAAGIPSIRVAILRQRWLTPFLSVTSVLLGLWLIIRGADAETAGVGRLAGCGFGGLLLAGVVGRGTGLQRWLDGEARLAMESLPGLGTGSVGNGVRVLVVLLAGNPLGLLAAFTSAAMGDARLLVWKAAVDVLTLMGIGRIPSPVAVGGVTISLMIHGGTYWLGLETAAWIESNRLAGAWLAGVGLVWLPLPLLLFRIRSVPLATMALVPVLAALVRLVWR